MNIDTLIQSDDIYALFDGCPTCGRENSEILNLYRTHAQQKQRQLHVISSGSQTATLIRTIAKNQEQTIKYPMLLIDGVIRHNPQDITERTTK